MTFFKFFFLALFSLPIFAQETAVVFIDLNNSFNEVKAAKKAAKERGEKFFVFPNSDAEKPFKAAQFAKALKALSDQKILITSLIVSGHHTQYAGYYGENHTNELHPDELREELKKYPNIRDSIRSFFGAGCHSMTKSQTQDWVNYFGNLEACYGYMDIGPGNQASSAGQNIYDFLIKEAEIAKYNTLDRIFKAGSPLLTYPYATASAIWTKGSGTYCDVSGSTQRITNCNILESLLEQSFITFRAKALEAYIYDAPRNKLVFGDLDSSQSLSKVASNKYKVKETLDLESLELNVNEMINQVTGLCSDSPLLKQITYADIEKLKHAKDLARNHRLYFATAIKEIKSLGAPYPRPGDSYEDFALFYKEAKKKIKTYYSKKTKKVKELNESWAGFWETFSEDHRRKMTKEKKRADRAKALYSIVSFMEGQFIDGECVTDDWKKDYKGVPSKTLGRKMKEDPTYCH